MLDCGRGAEDGTRPAPGARRLERGPDPAGHRPSEGRQPPRATCPASLPASESVWGVPSWRSHPASPRGRCGGGEASGGTPVNTLRSPTV